MRYDIDPDVINQPARGAAASISYEPDYLLPHAEHKLEILNHSPKSTRRPKILIIDDDEDLCLGLRIRLLNTSRIKA